MRYGVCLEGWPLPNLKNASNISNLGDLNKVIDALKKGDCFWKKLSPEEYLERKEQLQQEVDAGTRKPLKHGGVGTEYNFSSVQRPAKRHKTG